MERRVARRCEALERRSASGAYFFSGLLQTRAGFDWHRAYSVFIDIGACVAIAVGTPFKVGSVVVTM